ncbi:MAG TPA: hypothetical protein VJW20_25105 [Candidatus Angelobacter sp.]|nr:hypothetical protein [Candidatus Angelobacter sp.]
MPTGPAAVPTPDGLQTKAGHYVQKLKATFENSEVNNYWRCGNAASSLLDYFLLGGKVTSPDFITAKHQWFEETYHQWFNETGNLWFDDYLWWTIAALKSRTDRFHAPWDHIFEITWANAQPALSVWKDAVRKYGKFQEYEPRFTPGVWNARWSEYGPWKEIEEKNGKKTIKDNALLGIQNAVVNLLYLYAAARSQNFIQKALAEYSFLTSWFNDTPVADSMLHRFTSPSNEACVLVHERVSTFHNGVPDPNYKTYSQFFWTGDQGLLLGSAMRLMGLSQAPAPVKTTCHDLALAVIRGVKQELVKKGELQPYTQGQSIPQDDVQDYNSGSGVFLRYVLEAWLAWPELKAELHRNGFDSLVLSMAGLAPDPPLSPSDDLNDCINPWTNHLATLLAAIAILKSPA